MVGVEYSGSSGTKIFSIDSMKIWMPAMMMIQAITIVVKRSILARCSENLRCLVSLSLIMMRKPAMESIKLWSASEVMAREPEIKPTKRLKKPSKKLTAIKR